MAKKKIMIDTKGNPKEEVNLLKHSVINYIESIDKLYNFYTNNIVKENTEVLLKIIDEHANGGFEIINRKLNKNVDYFYEHNVFIEDLLEA